MMHKRDESKMGGQSKLTVLSVAVLVVVVTLGLSMPNASSVDGSASIATTFDLKTKDKDRPILVLGLPRSGSLALHKFFECNGIKSVHYCCGGKHEEQKTKFSCGKDVQTCGQCVHSNMVKGRKSLEGCGPAGTQVFSQIDAETSDPFSWFLPQVFSLSLFERDYPNAIWILNSRKSASIWATNVLHWHSVTTRLFQAFGLEYDELIPASRVKIAPEDDMANSETREALDESIARAHNTSAHQYRRSLLEELYFNHNHHIFEQSTLLRPKKNNLLLTINVDDPRAGEFLASFFSGMKEECWSFDADALDNDWKDMGLPL